MHVLATAGHVDHGKSSLVRALTGMEPDRYAEEQRRGLTIDLGFAWTTLDGERLAFVDVPGHERFVPTMLAGVGPVPAAVLVVAADGGWMPQTQEHVDALDALQVRHGLLVVTRSDLADPAPVAEEARERLRHTGLARVEQVATSVVTGAGLDDVRSALVRLVRSLPEPDREAPVRLWVDRAFSIKGAGTVVTGTLGAGTLHRGDHLVLPDGQECVVRGLQSLDEPHDAVPAVARVAVNLRGVERGEVQRGDALTTPGAFWRSDVVDVRVQPSPARPPATALLHLGSSQVEAHVRPLAGSDVWRLQLRRPLPLRIGDVGLLRDPGRHAVLAGVTVLDVDPPALRRRGAGARRAAELVDATGVPDLARELRLRGVVQRAHLAAMGVSDEQLSTVAAQGEWLVDPEHARELLVRLSELLDAHDRSQPLDRGLPLEVARSSLGLPDVEVVRAVVRAPLAVVRGRVVRPDRDAGGLPEAVAAAVARLCAELGSLPLQAPSAERLAELGLGRREVAAAVRAGLLVDAGQGTVLAPQGVERAIEELLGLPAPFTVAQARDAWQSSRRVVVPLLELLDRRGVTRRLPDGSRLLGQTGAARGRLDA